MAVHRTRGFTLVELLVVLGVIGLIGSMLLPALQAAREAARMNTCRSHVSQLAKGLLQHETLQGYFPSAGWGPNWLGVAERTSDSSQPGSWIYSVLPYIEEKDLRNSVTGVTAASAGAAYAKLVTASIPVTACPSRRKSQTLYIPASPTGLRTMTVATGTLPPISTAVRTDYAINSGTTGACVPVAMYKGAFQSLTSSSYNGKKVSLCHKGKTQSIGLPAVTSAGHEDDTLGACESCDSPFSTANMRTFATLADGDQWRKMSLKDKVLTDLTDLGIPDTQDGVAFRMSRLQAASILDGLSNTYLIGEKYVMAGKYDVGSDDGDCRPMMVGYSHDNVRWAIDPPAADARQVSQPTVFGR